LATIRYDITAVGTNLEEYKAVNALNGRMDLWTQDVPNTLKQLRDKQESLTEDIINLKNEVNTKLHIRVHNAAWKEAKNNLDAAIETARNMALSLRLDVDIWRRKTDESLASIEHDITAVKATLETSLSDYATEVKVSAWVRDVAVRESMVETRFRTLERAARNSAQGITYLRRQVDGMMRYVSSLPWPN